LYRNSYPLFLFLLHPRAPDSGCPHVPVVDNRRPIARAGQRRNDWRWREAMRNVFDRGRLLRRVPIAVLAGLIAVGPGGTVGHTAKGPTASPRPADDVRRLGPRVEPEQRWLVAPDFTFTVAPSLHSLRDYRGERMVLLVLYTLPESRPRLRDLALGGETKKRAHQRRSTCIDARRGRQLRRAGEALPADDVEIREARFLRRRNLGEPRQPGRMDHGQPADLPALDQARRFAPLLAGEV